MSKFLIIFLLSIPSVFSKNFLIVTKISSNFFYEEIGRGCRVASLKSGDKCIFANVPVSNPRIQMQVIDKALKENKIDGMAIAVINSSFTVKYLNKLKIKIPIVTVDSDFEDADLSKLVSPSLSYIGTNNIELGSSLGKRFLKFKPTGNYCILSGHNYSKNLNDRITGFEKEINKYKELSQLERCPLHSRDEASTILRHIVYLVEKYKDTKKNLSIALMGGWPQFEKNKYLEKIGQYKKILENRKVNIISMDLSQSQKELVNEGYSLLNVGQNPYLMGVKAIEVLRSITAGKKIKDKYYTDTISCTKEKC